jgi:RNA polymerase sigma-70 factor (ECF subfamily)
MTHEGELDIHGRELAQHAGFARAIARAILNREDLADDAVQDALAAAWGSKPRNQGRLRSWFGGIVRHKALDIRRREATRLAREHAGEAQSKSDDPAVVAERADMGRRVVEQVLALPEAHRHVILLRFHSGRTIQEVATLLDVPVETVRTRQRRALAQLRVVFDARDEGTRPSLALLAVPWAQAEPTTPATIVGGLLMGKKVAAVVGVLLILGSTAWWMGHDDDAASVEEVTPVAEHALPRDGPPVLRALDSSAKKEPGQKLTDASPADRAVAVAARIHFTGTVVDKAGTPVKGASVRYQTPARNYPAVATGADGHFRVLGERVPPRHWTPGLILVTTRDGRVASKDQDAYETMADEVRVGTLMLQGGVTLAVQVGPQEATSKPVDVYVIRRGQRGGQFIARAKTDEHGRCTFHGLPGASCRLIAHTPGWGRGVLATTVPRERGDPAVIEMPPERVVEVKIVDKVTRVPVSGAILDLWEQIRGPRWRAIRAYLPRVQVPPTDENGQTVIPGLGDQEHVLFIVSAAGYPEPHSANGFPGTRLPRLPPDGRSLLIELDPPRTIRWPLSSQEGPIPPDGARIVLRERRGPKERAPLPTTARVENGVLLGEGFAPGHIHALAVAPNGSVARLFCRSGTNDGREVSFRPGRTVRVRVSLPDGAPVRGLWAVTRNQGNNPLHDPVPLDDKGTALIEGLYGGLAEVYVVESPDSWQGTRVGSVDLAKGGGDFELTVQPEHTAVLSVLIDGKPGVPPAGRLLAHGAGAVAHEVNEKLGELVLRWRPPEAGGKRTFTYSASGHTQATTELVAGAGIGPDRATLHMKRAGTLVVRLLLPEDKNVALVVQVWNPASDTWSGAPVFAPPGGGIDPSGVIRFAPLAPGRYRVIEAGTGLISDPVELAEGGTSVELRFDVSQVGDVQGRVRVPDGVDPTTVGVNLLDASTGKPLPNPHGWKRGQVNKEGVFYVRVPGSREVLLVPSHAFLRPATVGGQVRMTKPRTGVVLRMIRGPTATLRFDPAPELPRHRKSDPRLRVLLFADEVKGEPLHVVEAPLKDDRIQFGGFEAGTYTLWIDVPGAAPVILEGVRLGDGQTDLGTTRTSPGTTVRLRILVKEGEAVPRVGVSAHGEGNPKYFRWTNTRGESVVELKGLGLGKFRFQVTAQMGALPKNIDRTIQADGTGIIEQVLDLR